jgi:hypothetical protein
MISPFCKTTASPLATFVAMPLKGILNFEKSLISETGKYNSDNLSQSSSASRNPVEILNLLFKQ